jgi:exopolysaccharide biosynthesis polyprenyl glycosylphosphotransferase
MRSSGHYRRPAILLSNQGRSWPGWVDRELEEFDVSAHLSVRDLFQYRSSLGSEGSSENGGRPRDAPVLIVNADGVEEEELWKLVLEAGKMGSPLLVRSPVRVVAHDRLATRVFNGRTIVKVSPPTLGGMKAFQKRAFDLVAGGALLLLTAPIMLAISLTVLVTSGLPIFYGQERIGKDGEIFRMWKFRTMRPDAEKDTGAVWASAGDPRRTRIGKWLRRSSLDELPQLCNVLTGRMSLVGPRPERPVFVDQFTRELSWYKYRHRIRPGITGWAQAQGLRGNTELSPRVDSDNWYIENWSLSLDLRILFDTLRELFRADNAY